MLKDLKNLSYNNYIKKYHTTKTKDILDLIDKNYVDANELLLKIVDLPIKSDIKNQLAQAVFNYDVHSIRECGAVAFQNEIVDVAKKKGLGNSSELFNSFFNVENERILFELLGDNDTARNLQKQEELILILNGDLELVYWYAKPTACDKKCKMLHNLKRPYPKRYVEEHKYLLSHPNCECYFKSTPPKNVYRIKDEFTDLPFSDEIHGVLDILGFIPAIGNIADGINTLLYIVEGDFFNAALSGISALPFVGYLGGSVKVINTGAKVVDKAMDGAKIVDKVIDSSKVFDNLLNATKNLDKADEIAKKVKLIENSSDAIKYIDDYRKLVNDILDGFNSGKNSSAELAEEVIQQLEKLPQIHRKTKMKIYDMNDIKTLLSNSTDTMQRVSTETSGLTFQEKINNSLKNYEELQKAVDNVVNPAVTTNKNKNLSDLKNMYKDGKINRNTWELSEKLGGEIYPNYQKQVSFNDGEIVTYGKKGSSRPDLFKAGESREIKNYDLRSSRGVNRLTRNIREGYQKRLQNLPVGTRQSVDIDVIGQDLTEDKIQKIYEKITKDIDGLDTISFWGGKK